MNILVSFIVAIYLNLAKFSVADTEFDREFVGVVFEPYTKHDIYDDEGGYRDRVSKQDIKDMLTLVGTKFRNISTWGVGTKGFTSTWENGSASAFTAIEASKINKENNTLLLNLNVGAWTFWNQFANQEMKNAIDASAAANKIFRGTVSGVVMIDSLDTEDFQRKALQMLKNNMDSAKIASLKFGIRCLGNCHGLINELSRNPPNQIIVDIIQLVDLVICTKFPTSYSNVSMEVENTGSLFLESNETFRKFNDKIEVIGETGWASVSITGERSERKLVQYWQEMGEWARLNAFRVNLFTAFDEPWKITLNQGPQQPHFGWWLRIKNDSSGAEAFIEKEKYKAPEKKMEVNTLGIALGLVGGILVLSLIAGMLFLYRKLIYVQNALLTKADIEEFEQGMKRKPSEIDDDTEEALLLPYDRSFEIPRSKLIIDEAAFLGSGAFGRVFKGKIEGRDEIVACKMTQSNITSTNLKSLLSEIKIMIHVGKHPNVVSIIGAYTEEMRKGIIMIAVEICDQGSLEKYLRSMKQALYDDNDYQNVLLCDRYVNAPNATQTSRIERLQADLLKWSSEIANGMDHIESRKVIHADLATRNILLTLNGTAKITDFGLSRRLYEYSNYVKQNQEPLPWRWMALESLQHLTFSSKSDVWSYGVVLFELFSLGEVPFPGLQWNVDFTEKLSTGLRMSKPKFATDAIYATMCDCWHVLPKQRPDFNNLADFFEQQIHEFESGEGDQAHVPVEDVEDT